MTDAPALDAAAPVAPTPPRPRKTRRASTRRTARQQRRFLAHSIVLEEGGTPGLLRAAILAVVVMVAAFVGWSSIAEIEEVTHSPGEVLSSVPIQRVQHLEGGIVAEILVREGEVVSAGQPMFRLDPTPSVAEMEQLKARAAALQLQVERLRAFAERRDPRFGTVTDAPQEMVIDQRAIYESQERSRATQREVIERQIAQRRAELTTLAEQEQRLRRTIGILEEEARMRAALFEKGLNSRLVVLDVERRLNEARGEASRTVGEQARARQALAEAGQRLADVDSTLIRDALTQMGQVNAEYAQLREAMSKQSDRVTRLTVFAPVDGVVKAVNSGTVGGVVTPGQEMLQIVPVGPELLVESRIEPRDIGSVREGQRVLVKVSAYDYARYGGIEGEVESVSPSTFIDEKTRPYYKARIRLARNHAGATAGRNLVVPGMTVQADISTGRKTLLEYLFKPIVLLSGEAFSER